MILVFDTEATGTQRNKAHPFDERNKATHFGFKDVDTKEKTIFKIEYDEEPYGRKLIEIQELLNNCTRLVTVNGKYDLHWLTRYNLTLPEGIRIFDCQLTFFILQRQKKSYPSLDDIASHYGHPLKYDIVKEEYWNKGIDTDSVPEPILLEYLNQDLDVTENCYLSLLEEFNNAPYKQRKLISISSQDLLVLSEMEENGFLYDNDHSMYLGDRIEGQLEEIDTKIKEISGLPWLNCNSPNHISAMLYGGVVYTDGKEAYTFYYKDGRTAEKLRSVKIPNEAKGYFDPLKGTENINGTFSTSKDTLVTLSEKASGQGEEIIKLLLHRAKLEQQRSTYYHGYPKKASHYNWRGNLIHSTFNQCVAVSGRLSSAKPNIQNVEGEVKYLFKSRFGRKHAP